MHTGLPVATLREAAQANATDHSANRCLRPTADWPAARSSAITQLQGVSGYCLSLGCAAIAALSSAGRLGAGATTVIDLNAKDVNDLVLINRMVLRERKLSHR